MTLNAEIRENLYDCKGNLIHNIPESVKETWYIYSASSMDDIRIIAPEPMAREFWRDTVGTMHKLLCTTTEIANAMHLSFDMAQAWLWSAAKYGLTQRQGFPGESEMYWVVE